MMSGNHYSDKDSIPTAIPVAKVVPTHPGSSVGSVGLLEDPNVRGFVVRQETQTTEYVRHSSVIALRWTTHCFS